MSAMHLRILGVLGVAAILAAGCSSSKKIQTGTPCVLNSDCNNPLSCTYGTCHEGCRSAADCTAKDAKCTKVSGFGVCLFSTESNCAANDPPCGVGLTCAIDLRCRSACTKADTDCMGSQVCVSGVCADPADLVGGELPKKGNGLDGGGSADGGGKGASDVPVTGGIVDAAESILDGGTSATGGLDGSGAGTGGVGGGKVDAPMTVTVCPQTQFGLVAEGDSNSHFQGGVGLRTASQLLILNAYTGPDPNATSDAGTSPVALVYVQAFDPVNPQKQGDARPLFTPQYVTGLAYNYSLVAAIAPTGQVAVIYYNNSGIGAAFLGPAAGDAGASPGNLQVTRQVQLEVTGIGSLPHVIWSVAFNAFVFSYQLGSVNGPIHVRKFYSDGRPVGGDTDGVPTDRSDNVGGATPGFAVVTNQNPYLGVFYGQWGPNAPFLTVLDTQGNQVGKTFSLQASPTGTSWLTGAATSTGYVAFYGQGGIQASFVSPDAKGNVSAAQYTDAGVVDGFHFNGTDNANGAIALNDDVGGAGGVGVAIAYGTKVSFAYVNADHSHVNPATVVPHTWDSAYDYVNISNSAGSFAVSLWNNAEHKVEVAATTCPQ